MPAALKLCQVSAIKTGKRKTLDDQVKNLHKLVQVQQFFQGRLKTYHPDRPEDPNTGEQLPPEQQKLQHKVQDVLNQARTVWTELWDLTFTQDVGNTKAVGDIVLDDGTVIMKNVPITSILYLDKQINDLETFVEHLPTPDPAEDWVYDETQGQLKSREPRKTTKQKKEPRTITKAPATDKFPAQVELIYEDKRVGEWEQILFSGAIQADKKQELLVKVRKLKDAIKKAKEQANQAEVTRLSLGKEVFDYVLGVR